MSPAIQSLNAAAEHWWVYVYHATWQASLVAAIAIVIVWVARRLPPTWRYGLLVLVLLKFMMPPMLDHAVGIFYWLGPQAMVPATSPSSGVSNNFFASARPFGLPPPAVDEPAPDAAPTDSGAAAVFIAVRDVRHLTWQSWLMILHGVGMVVMLVWITARLRRLAVLSRKAEWIRRGPLRDRLPAIAQAVNGPDEVDLLITDRPVPPMAFWLLRAKIVIPRTMIGRLNGQELEALIGWLLIQHRRNDWAAHLLQLVVCTAWWFNPLAWIVSAFAAWTRAECCDDALLASPLTTAQGFRQAMVECVEEVARPHPAAPIAALMERIRPVALRIDRLTDATVFRGPEFSYAALIPLILIALTVLPGIRSRPASSPSAANYQAAPPPDVMRVTVVDAETDQPLESATLNTSTGLVEPAAPGHWLVRYNASTGYVGFTAQASGYVPIQVFYQAAFDRTTGRLPGARRVEAPESYRLKLPRATAIGGIVEDEAGRPVEGAQVMLLVPSTQTPNYGQAVHGEAIAIGERAFVTDAQGRWSCDLVPADMHRVMLRVIHPQYLSDAYYGVRVSPPIDKLRQHTAVMVLKRGHSIEGVVLDTDGLPLEGAMVWLGDQRFAPTGLPSTSTDEDGRFAFENVPPGVNLVTVQHEAFAPDQKPAVASADAQRVEFRLQPGRVLRGRVTDSEGNGIARATILAERWRGNQALARQALSDEDGRFELVGLPADPIAYGIHAQGFMRISDRIMTAGDESYEITMVAPLRVRGSVTDARTGEPIPRFSVVQGFSYNRSLTNVATFWERFGESPAGVDGQYEVVFTYPRQGHLVRIEAEGYAPAVSRTFRDDEGQAVFDFKLEEAPPLSGVLRAPDGSPVAGAALALATPGQMVYVQGATILPQGHYMTTTDDQGRFSFPREVGPWTLVAVHVRGYVEVPGTSWDLTGGEISLQPWGGIEGVLRLSGKPAPDERIGLSRSWDESRPTIYFSGETVTTDDEGRFAFDVVPPGEIFVSRQKQVGPQTWSASPQQKVHVRSGETTQVLFGGQGRRVVGRVAQPEGRPIDLTQSYGYLMSRSAVDAVGALARALGVSSTADSQVNPIGFQLEPDGSFTIEDVPAGTYSLNIQVHGADPQQPNRVRVVARATLDLAIRTETGNSDAPIDLGTLSLQPLAAPAEDPLGRVLKALGQP